MGNRKWHLARAEHCKETADYLSKKARFIDWAVVALFYSAHHQVHSALADEDDLVKDERHPRKHVGFGNDSRGTNQLVGVKYTAIRGQYLSLYDASRRTRYDFAKLGPDAYERFEQQHEAIVKYIDLINRCRPEISSQTP